MDNRAKQINRSKLLKTSELGFQVVERYYIVVPPVFHDIAAPIVHVRRHVRWRCLYFSRTLCHLMYNYPVNHGDMWTIVMGIVNASPQVIWVLMVYPSCPGIVYLCRNWRRSQSLPGEVVWGQATYLVQARSGQDRCHLCLINQALMATCFWLSMCGGRRACW